MEEIPEERDERKREIWEQIRKEQQEANEKRRGQPRFTLKGRVWLPQLVATLMLLWALYPSNPYGYYILLRWVCCAVFVYLALGAYTQGKEGWVLVFGITAAIYNPILRVHLTREIWSGINVATVVVAVASVSVLKLSEEDSKDRV